MAESPYYLAAEQAATRLSNYCDLGQMNLFCLATVSTSISPRRCWTYCKYRMCSHPRFYPRGPTHEHIFFKHTLNKDSTLTAKHTLNEDFVGFLLQFWLWSEIFLKWWDFKNGLWSLFLENDWLWHPKCYTCPGHSCLLTVFYFSGLTGPLRASTPHVMAHAVCIQVQYRI